MVHLSFVRFTVCPVVVPFHHLCYIRSTTSCSLVYCPIRVLNLRPSITLRFFASQQFFNDILRKVPFYVPYVNNRNCSYMYIFYNNRIYFWSILLGYLQNLLKIFAYPLLSSLLYNNFALLNFLNFTFIIFSILLVTNFKL